MLLAGILFDWSWCALLQNWMFFTCQVINKSHRKDPVVTPISVILFNCSHNMNVHHQYIAFKDEVPFDCAWA